MTQVSSNLFFFRGKQKSVYFHAPLSNISKTNDQSCTESSVQVSGSKQCIASTCKILIIRHPWLCQRVRYIQCWVFVWLPELMWLPVAKVSSLITLLFPPLPPADGLPALAFSISSLTLIGMLAVITYTVSCAHQRLICTVIMTKHSAVNAVTLIGFTPEFWSLVWWKIFWKRTVGGSELKMYLNGFSYHILFTMEWSHMYSSAGNCYKGL